MGRSKRKASQNAAGAAVPISELPNHIMCEILSRLPLDSIVVHCKRVCKTWRNLILEPHFAKLHLSRSLLSLVSYRNGIYNNSPSYFEIIELPDPSVISRVNAPMKFKTKIFFPHMDIQIVGSCDGSILLSNCCPNYDLIIVWNPLRVQHLILPKPPQLALPINTVSLGFGHSILTDQYKVLRLTRTCSLARLDCDIYTIGIDDEWRRIGNTGQLPAHTISQIIFLNGALHWLGFENSWVIYYFDIEKEQFGSFPLPSHLGKTLLHLGVVDNWLYILHVCSFWKCWVMKDYGDFGSWTLEWVIEAREFNGSVKPLKILKDGTVLMMFNNLSERINANETTLASYNPQTRVLKKIRLMYHSSALQWML